MRGPECWNLTKLVPSALNQFLQRFGRAVIERVGDFNWPSGRTHIFLFPIDAEFAEVNAPGGRNPYSPAPILSGRTTVKVRLAILLPSKSTRSRVTPPDA